MKNLNKEIMEEFKKDFEETFGKRTARSIGWNLKAEITIGKWLEKTLLNALKRKDEAVVKLLEGKMKKQYPDRFPPMYWLFVDWGLIKTI